MKIAGLQKNSFVDYRGKISAVVFTQGCNMNCFYCHNRGILCSREDQGAYCAEKVLRFLAERRRFLDGVVISGGEPTLQHDLEDFILKLKGMGYPVKLDTNGTDPEKLRRLIERCLVDYVAMDIKAPLDRYEEICGTAVDLKAVEESIDLLMEEKVDYEFRTTVVPELHEGDLSEIAHRIKGARLYILQQFRQPLDFKEIVDYRALKTPHSSAFLRDVTSKVAGYVRRYETRGVI